MSGICGMFHTDSAPVKVEELQGMAQSAAHRGPDGIGYWIDNNVGLAHLHNHIAPEDLTVPQPVRSADGNLTIVAQARIDNRDDLIPLLLSEGMLRHDSPSDAELILACYQRWGIACPAHLIAHFAFAIWDGRNKVLFAARDMLGTRPFYYREEPARFLFASEAKQILALPDVPCELNEAALGRWLANAEGHIEESFYQGILQLAPGHALLTTSASVKTWRYDAFSNEKPIRYRDEREYVEHFQETFFTSLSSRLRTIKPVGISLSGGMDSSSVAAGAGWLINKGTIDPSPEVRTYSYDFGSLTTADERHISTPLAQHFGFAVVGIPAEENWPLKDYPLHGPDKDDPNLGPYQVLKNAALTRARQDGVGAMLTGYWGDHIVNDLWPYVDQLFAGQWSQLWQDAQAHSQAWDWELKDVLNQYLLRPFPGYIWPPHAAPRLRILAGQVRRSLPFRQSATPGGRTLPAWMRQDFAARIGLSDREIPPHHNDRIRGYAAGERFAGMSHAFQLQSTLWQERTHALQGITLTHVWNDRRIIEFALSVPPRILSRRGEYKPFARAMMKGIMPDEALNSVAKIYPTPLFWQATKGPARNTIESLLTHSRLAEMGFVDEKTLLDRFDETLIKEDDRTDFWAPLSAEIWLRAHWT